MLMIAPSGGDTFVGNSGFTYTGASLATLEVGNADVSEALLRNWVPTTYPGTVVVLTPTTGFSYPVQNMTMVVVLNPAGTLATGTITMSPNPNDNQGLRVLSTQTVTALTLTANSGQSMSGAPTTVSATSPVDLVYNATLATWLRR